MESASLIELLKQSAPAVLETLKKDFPSVPDLFSTRRMLGPDDQQPQATERAAKLALVGNSLNVVAADLDSSASSVRQTMKLVSRIRFSGAVVATVAGGIAAILALYTSTDKVAQAVTAFAAMLGGVATATADQFERAPSGLRIASTDEYAKLVQMRADLELIRLQVQQDRIIPLSDDELKGLVTKLNQFAMNVLRLRMA
jgi:hypothetical protein